MTAVDRDKSRYVLFDTNYFLQSYIFLIEIGWPMEDLKKSLLYFVNYFITDYEIITSYDITGYTLKMVYI